MPELRGSTPKKVPPIVDFNHTIEGTKHKQGKFNLGNLRTSLPLISEEGQTYCQSLNIWSESFLKHGLWSVPSKDSYPFNLYFSIER